jgi:hypothetical protein
MTFSDAGKATPWIWEESQKALTPIRSTPSSKLKATREKRCEKALSPICVNPWGIQGLCSHTYLQPNVMTHIILSLVHPAETGHSESKNYV